MASTCCSGHLRAEEHFPLFAPLKETGYDGVELEIFEGTPDYYARVARELDADAHSEAAEYAAQAGVPLAVEALKCGRSTR